MWFIPWLPLQLHCCLILGSLAATMVVLFWNLPWSFLPVGPFHMHSFFLQTMPLEMKFFLSTIYCVLSFCLCAKNSGAPEKAMLQESRHGPCSHGTCSLWGEPDINQIITSGMPNGHCNKARWWQVELYEIAAIQSFLTGKRNLIELNWTCDPEVTEGSWAERSIWCKWYFRTSNLVLV